MTVMEMDFLRMLEGIRNPFFDAVFQFITYFGEQVLATAMICFIFWCVDKNFGYKIGFSFFFAGLALQGLKITFRIDRPWVTDPSFRAVESAVPAATGYSFPSGHTQTATSVFFALALFFKKTWAKVLCVAAFLLVGFSRMYLGVHTPKDVIVGMALGIVAVLVFSRLFEKIKDDKSKDPLILVIMCVCSVALVAYALIMYGTSVIEIKYAYDCCKAGGAGLGFAIAWFIERKYINFSVKVPKQYMHLIKMAVGLSVAVLLMEGPKFVLGESIPVDIIRYMLATLWCVGLFPYLTKNAIERYEKKHGNANANE